MNEVIDTFSPSLKMEDFLDDCNSKTYNDNRKNKSGTNDQRKYSHTAKVKPWRVGGHQTQICPKGQKKGFRK